MTTEKFIESKEKQFLKEKENGTLIKVKDIGRQGFLYWKREAWTFLPQSNYPEKVFVFERLTKDHFEGKLTHQDLFQKGDIEYRIGYFIVGKIGKAKDKWVWGQYAPFILIKDLSELIKKAKKEKVLL